jgi:hypothetical protein
MTVECAPKPRFADEWVDVPAHSQRRQSSLVDRAPDRTRIPYSEQPEVNVGVARDLDRDGRILASADRYEYA